MHYRHRFHAGNFADVFKHVFVCGLLEALSRKDSGWCFVDTHAGAGAYDLGGDSAAATAEWRAGIGRLGAAPASAPIATTPAMLGRYVALVREYGGASLRAYPGSPLLAAALARPQDGLLLCERVPEVAAELRQTMGTRATVHLRDGYEAVSLLPPAAKRGLVLIDPPFERTDEFDAIAAFISAAVARFAGGVYAAWYPLKNTHVASRFRRRVARETARPVLDLRLDIGLDAGLDLGLARGTGAIGAAYGAVQPRAPVTRATGPRVHVFSPRKAAAPAKVRMHACGLLIVNPPFGFAAAARETLAVLAPLLAQGVQASWQVESIAND